MATADPPGTSGFDCPRPPFRLQGKRNQIQYAHITQVMKRLGTSVVDPNLNPQDVYVFGPLGSGSFHHDTIKQERKKKPWFLLFLTYLWKPLTKTAGNSVVRILGFGSVPKCHKSTTFLGTFWNTGGLWGYGKKSIWNFLPMFKERIQVLRRWKTADTSLCGLASSRARTT